MMVKRVVAFMLAVSRRCVSLRRMNEFQIRSAVDRQTPGTRFICKDETEARKRIEKTRVRKDPESRDISLFLDRSVALPL